MTAAHAACCGRKTIAGAIGVNSMSLGLIRGRFGGYRYGYGHGGIGVIGIILIILLVLFVMGRL